MFTVKYTGDVRETYRNLPPEIKAIAKEALNGIKDNPFAGKPLTGELLEYYSIRCKRYRVVYKIDGTNKTAIVYAIGHRSNIYEYMAALVKGEQGGMDVP